MTHDEFRKETQRLATIMKDANLSLALLASIDLAKLALDHPQYWVDHRGKADVSAIRRALEETIANSEKLLGVAPRPRPLEKRRSRPAIARRPATA